MKFDFAALGTSQRLLTPLNADASGRKREEGGDVFMRLAAMPMVDIDPEKLAGAVPLNPDKRSPNDEGRENAIAAVVAALNGGAARTTISEGKASDATSVTLEQAGARSAVTKAEAAGERMPTDLAPIPQGSNAGEEVSGPSGELQVRRAGLTADKEMPAGGRQADGAALTKGPVIERSVDQDSGLHDESRVRNDADEGVARSDNRPVAPAREPVSPASQPFAPAQQNGGAAASPPPAPNTMDATPRAMNPAVARSARSEAIEIARSSEPGSKSIFGSDGAALQPRVVQGPNAVTNVPIGNFWQVVTTSAGPSIVNSLSSLSAAPLLSDTQQASQFSMQVQLHPKSLGEVSIHITRVGGTVNVDIRTQTVQAERLLKSDSGNLLDAFKASDGRVEEVNLRVVTSQESQGSALRNGREGDRDGWFARGGFDEGGNGKPAQQGEERGQSRLTDSPDRGAERVGDGFAPDANTQKRTGTYL